jgi:hypothetical protein
MGQLEMPVNPLGLQILEAAGQLVGLVILLGLAEQVELEDSRVVVVAAAAPA